MDALAADLALQAILGRGSDFVGGIDNEALDFSQLEDFINSEGSQGNGTYFGESLNTTQGSTTDKLLNVIVENKRNAGHSLPESPPDSSSEHPYSPQDGAETNLTSQNDSMYTLGQNLYKTTTILNPIISDNLILGSHILVTESGHGENLIENNLQQSSNNTQILSNNNNILQNAQLVIADELNSIRNVNNMYKIHHGENDQNIITLNTDTDSNRQGQISQGQIIISTSNNDLQTYHSPNSSSSSIDRNGLYKNADNAFDKNQMMQISYTNVDNNLSLNNRVGLDGGVADSQGVEGISTVYTNLQNAPKKRKLSQDTALLVKNEPEHCSVSQLSPNGALSNSLDEEYASSEACLSESQYQCIRFSTFLQTEWYTLCDQNLAELPLPHYRVDADKGFNFSNADDAFVCQKKNHFQVTCHVQLQGDAQFVKTAKGIQKISSFHLHFYGVKHDCPTQTIRVEQSQSDRSKKAFHPVQIELVSTQVTKITVGRLHFSETTSNNMRKKGKPNPEQRYFQLVVGLHAHTSSGNFPIISHASQKIIVRASNPGQFESDVELCWQKGQTQDSVFHSGKVGINTDRPDECLVVYGNIKITGHIIQPSDIRAKKNIVECDTAKQLRNVQKLRVVNYDYDPTFASQLSRGSASSDTGVIAQEVAEVLPEAVSPAGDIILENGTSIDNFLVVNKERIFMENIGAVKELCKVTDNLETRIGQLERINKRLNKLKKSDSFKSTSTTSTLNSKLSHAASHYCSKGRKKCTKDQEELCSNKFIQVVIVILVLIMAFCLAAITTLYFMEASRQTNFTQHMQDIQSVRTQKRPPKTSKSYPWYNQATYNPAWDKENKIYKGIVDSTLVRKSYTIGRPVDCNRFDQDLESSNLCPIYCCAPPPNIVVPPLDVSSSLYSEKSASPKNQTEIPLLNGEKAKIAKPFHSNDIEKQVRQRRDALEDDNSFDSSDDHNFIIKIQGRSFNTTLTNKYLNLLGSNGYNISYTVPISKYMPDEFVNLIFEASQIHFRDIEHCHNNLRKRECAYSYFEKSAQKHKSNENNSSGQQSLLSSVTFEVDMGDFQAKIMTYRLPLRQTESVCKQGRLGVDFIEYNFNFYRQCDE